MSAALAAIVWSWRPGWLAYLGPELQRTAYRMVRAEYVRVTGSTARTFDRRCRAAIGSAVSVAEPEDWLRVARSIAAHASRQSWAVASPVHAPCGSSRVPSGGSRAQDGRWPEQEKHSMVLVGPHATLKSILLRLRP